MPTHGGDQKGLHRAPHGDAKVLEQRAAPQTADQRAKASMRRRQQDGLDEAQRTTRSQMMNSTMGPMNGSALAPAVFFGAAVARRAPGERRHRRGSTGLASSCGASWLQPL
jgi:hypothetical protein